MNNNKRWIWLKEHYNEIFISVLFLIMLFGIYVYAEEIFSTESIPTTFGSIVVLFGIFLAWIQFIFYKYNKKKEAAITYFPRPLELEKLESEIDEIINFWTRNDPLDNYEVKLMMGSKIEKEEYKLIWQKLSITTQINIIKQSPNKKKVGKKVDKKLLKYKKSYNLYINETYKKARRKLNAYLNQVEAYCLAINKGNIDLKSARELFGHKFTENFRKARPYIETVRKEKNDSEIYEDFETVLKKWGKV